MTDPNVLVKGNHVGIAKGVHLTVDNELGTSDHVVIASMRGAARWPITIRGGTRGEFDGAVWEWIVWNEVSTDLLPFYFGVPSSPTTRAPVSVINAAAGTVGPMPYNGVVRVRATFTAAGEINWNGIGLTGSVAEAGKRLVVVMPVTAGETSLLTDSAAAAAAISVAILSPS